MPNKSGGHPLESISALFHLFQNQKKYKIQTKNTNSQINQVCTHLRVLHHFINLISNWVFPRTSNCNLHKFVHQPAPKCTNILIFDNVHQSLPITICTNVPPIWNTSSNSGGLNARHNSSLSSKPPSWIAKHTSADAPSNTRSHFRVDIWRDRCDRRSCKILVSHVNFQKISLTT